MKRSFKSPFKLLAPSIKLEPGLLNKKYVKGSDIYYASEDYTVKGANQFKHVGLKVEGATGRVVAYLLDGKREVTYLLPAGTQWSFVERLDTSCNGFEERITYEGIDGSDLLFSYFTVQIEAKPGKEGLFVTRREGYHMDRRKEEIRVPMDEKIVNIKNLQVELMAVSESELRLRAS